MIYRRDLDNQGCCNQWQHGIRTINNQYPDDNRDFDINAGDGIEITPATAGITIAVKAPLPGPMVYQGTVGTGGTIASLPAANVTNIGWTYIAITAGSTPDDTPKSYEIGDMIISNGEEWTVVPAGDDPVLWSDIQNKPTTLSGYGITDAVTIGTAQTITGDKQFDGALSKHATTFAEVSLKSDRATGNLGGLQSYDSTNKLRTAYTGNAQANNESRAQMYAYDASNSNNRNILTVGFNPNQTGSNRFYSVLADQRDYNSANTGDIVTIGSLASNPSVVHTTGNETIAGIKTFTNELYFSSVKHRMLWSDESTKGNTTIATISPNGVTQGRITVVANDDGTVSLVLAKYTNGSYVNGTTVATL